MPTERGGKPQSHVPRILVVDDEIVITEILSDFLSMEGWHVETATSGRQALELLGTGVFDVMISDLKMPEMSGLGLMEEVRRRHERVVILIMTAFGTVETAIEAMKKGAHDYILKPFKMEEVVEIVKRALEMKRLADENIQLRSMVSLYELSEELDFSQSAEAVLDRILDFAMGHVDADELSVYVARPGEKVLELGRSRQAEGLESSADIDIERISSGTEAGHSLLMHGEGVRDLVRSEGHLPEAVLSIPMVHRSIRVGVLNAISWRRSGKFTEGHRRLLSIVSGRAAASIVNSRLMEELRDTVRQTIQSLAQALEAMDRYTAGHSDRVTNYSRIIGVELGLDAGEVEIITQAALMHDIGKIGCHANLNKPDKLTAQEYEIFKEHPSHGRKILEPLTFLHPLIPGVHLHHERWDGKGYPEGLAGADIPLLARILAVADSYDAMTSSRAYRKALDHKVAIEELRRCAGSQFDPDIVEAFHRAIVREMAEQGREDPGA